MSPINSNISSLLLSTTIKQEKTHDLLSTFSSFCVDWGIMLVAIDHRHFFLPQIATNLQESVKGPLNTTEYQS